MCSRSESSQTSILFCKWVIASIASLTVQDSKHHTQFVELVAVEKAEGLKIPFLLLQFHFFRAHTVENKEICLLSG